MKTIIACILVAVLIGGCSSAKTKIVASKIKEKKHSQQKDRSGSPDKALLDLARQVAKTLNHQGRVANNVVVDSMQCQTKTDSKSLSTYLDNLFREYLVQASQTGRFHVIETQKRISDSISGTPIIRTDFSVKIDCLKVTERLMVIASLIEEQSARAVAVFSVWISKKGWYREEGFVVLPNSVYDSVTKLYWNRFFNHTNFTYREARSYCNGLVINGFDDWRLPDSEELYSLIARPVKQKQSMFRYRYGYLWQEQGCHWLDKSNSIETDTAGINLDSGKFVYPSRIRLSLGLAKQQECQVKCVRKK